MKRKIVIIMIILILIIPLKNFAKYYKTISNIKLSFEIANPVIEIEKDETILKKVNMQNNIIDEFYFKIKNYNDSKISEIGLIYKIEILNTNNDIPIEIKLYDCETEKELLNGDNESEPINLPKNIKTENNYKMIIKTKNLKSDKSLNTKIDVKISLETKME